nr:MAG TPA: hypothetical protein [Caudoviricetes sp.]
MLNPNFLKSTFPLTLPTLTSVRAGLQSCIATGTALNLQVESVPA